MTSSNQEEPIVSDEAAAAYEALLSSASHLIFRDESLPGFQPFFVGTQTGTRGSVNRTKRSDAALATFTLHSKSGSEEELIAHFAVHMLDVPNTFEDAKRTGNPYMVHVLLAGDRLAGLMTKPPQQSEMQLMGGDGYATNVSAISTGHAGVSVASNGLLGNMCVTHTSPTAEHPRIELYFKQQTAVNVYAAFCLVGACLIKNPPTMVQGLKAAGGAVLPGSVLNKYTHTPLSGYQPCKEIIFTQGMALNLRKDLVTMVASEQIMRVMSPDPNIVS